MSMVASPRRNMVCNHASFSWTEAPDRNVSLCHSRGVQPVKIADDSRRRVMGVTFGTKCVVVGEVFQWSYPEAWHWTLGRTPLQYPTLQVLCIVQPSNLFLVIEDGRLANIALTC